MRDIRSALDDLLGVLAPGHSLILRSTVAPGTTEFVAGYLAKHRGFEIGEEVFVAHAPERIAAGRFLEEIDTLPCIIGGVGARSGEVVGELFGVFAAPIVQTTPVQAELAKIWTNILRYTHFALPNLLMMDCERSSANVFEVIDLINRDYPRGGIAQPGLHRRDMPAQGLRLLGGALARAGHAARRLAGERVGAAVPARRGQAAPRRARNRKVAVLGLAFKADTDDERDSLAHKLIRLLERELADVAVHDPRAHADDVVRGGRRGRRRGHLPPTTRSSAIRGRWPRSPSEPAGTAWSSTRGTAGAPPRCSPTPPSWPPWSRADEQGAGHGRRRHDRRRGRQAPARRSRLRGARVRPAPGAAVDARGLRGAHRRPARARGGARGDEGLHPRDPPRGDRRGHRQLPPAAPHADRGQQRALQRRHPRGARPRGRALRVRVLLDGVRARRAVPRRPRTTCRSARSRSRPTASPSSPARSTAAPPTRSTACPTRSAARSTPTARASCPTPSRGSPTPCPT